LYRGARSGSRRLRKVIALASGDEADHNRRMGDKREATTGLWGEVARATPDRRDLARALVAELDEGLQLLSTLPAAVTFFGGARIARDDPFYEVAERMGELLARRGVPPRTGAGPGIMTAVPEGFRRVLTAQGAVPPPPLRDGATHGQLLTQGFNIQLPFEQAVNPAIDVHLELVNFPTRKLMLYVNSVGLVIFPGGFGTLDELLEVWRLKAAGRLLFPFVLFGSDFWKPLMDVLRQIGGSAGRGTIPDDEFSLVHLIDDPEEAVELISRAPVRPAFDEPLAELGERIALELVDGLHFLQELPAAVTVLGGSRLGEDDAAVRTVEEIARALAQQGVPTRAGGQGPISIALARGGHRGHRLLPQQAFGMRREDHRNLYGADRVHLVNDRLTHKVLLTENTRAILALPGGLGTLDELFSVLCQLQTRKIPHRRVVLFDGAYWRPLLQTLEALMLRGPRKTISEADLELVTVTDDPDEAVQLLLEPPAPLAAKTTRG
jgi:uncharacterized protein (TIGR00730 family)